MAPRVEFVLVSVALAVLLLVAVLMLLDFGGQRAPGLRDVLAALKFAPVAILASGIGAWFVASWHRRAVDKGRRWAAGGMTLRTLLVAFLLFPLALCAWLLAATAIDQSLAVQPAGWRESLGWLPVIVFYGSAIAVVFGAVPAFILEYFVCRRYLRRQASVHTGSA